MPWFTGILTPDHNSDADVFLFRKTRICIEAAQKNIFREI